MLGGASRATTASRGSPVACAAVRPSHPGARAPSSAPAPARFSGVFARASSGGGPILALERVRAKASLEGTERLLKRQRAYVKPTLARQKNVRDAAYNTVKRQRARLVEELVLQRKLWPW